MVVDGEMDGVAGDWRQAAVYDRERSVGILQAKESREVHSKCGCGHGATYRTCRDVVNVAGGAGPIAIMRNSNVSPR